ncbi:hypothetical protein BD560DRAFT_338995 [Blakeslea trispora]|nr:hypothetical protein BD560DRAFT_338995 [Blakeslea trispora]
MFTCIVCDQTFHRAHNLKSHMATHSATKPFQCDDCGKQFLRFHDLKRHQKLHTGERPHHCPNCKRSFSRLDALNRHKKTEGGSACLRSTKSKNTIATVSMPSMTTQWQVQPKALPNPFFSSSSSSNLSSSSSSPPTLPAPILSTSSSSSPPLAPLQPQPSMATSLPPFIIPFSNSTPDQDEIDVLKQRIHDLEVEVK